MRGREKEDTDVFAVWFGWLFLAQRGLTRLWLVGLAAHGSAGLAQLRPPRTRSWWCREALYAMPLLLSPKIRVHTSLSPALLTACMIFGQEDPQVLLSLQVPLHSLLGLSPPVQLCRGWMHQSQKAAGKWESFTAANHISCASKQDPATSLAFPPATDLGNISASTLGFPWRDGKSLGPVIFLPAS